MKSKRILISKVCKKKKNREDDLLNEDKIIEFNSIPFNQSLIKRNEENQNTIIELLNQLKTLKDLSIKQYQIGKDIENKIEFNNMINEKIRIFKDKNLHKYYQIFFDKIKQELLNNNSFFKKDLKFFYQCFIRMIFSKINLKIINRKLKLKFILSLFKNKTQRNKRIIILRNIYKKQSILFIYKKNFKQLKINVSKNIYKKDKIFKYKKEKIRFYFYKLKSLISNYIRKNKELILNIYFYNKIFFTILKNNLKKKTKNNNELNKIKIDLNRIIVKRFILKCRNQINLKSKKKNYKKQIFLFKKTIRKYSLYYIYQKICFYRYKKRILKENKLISEINLNVYNNELQLKNFNKNYEEIERSIKRKYNYLNYLKEQKNTYLKLNLSLEEQKLNYDKNVNEIYLKNLNDIETFSEVMKENKKLLNELELKELESKTNFPLIFHKKNKFSEKLKKEI